MSADYCGHVDCRCHAYEELAFMARALGRKDLEAKANALVQKGSVRCRRVPRRGPAPAPFYEDAS